MLAAWSCRLKHVRRQLQVEIEAAVKKEREEANQRLEHDLEEARALWEAENDKEMAERLEEWKKEQDASQQVRGLEVMAAAK